jgi:EAL domain-containing protein (putative c-di-GMP-specific phosphodiesterase class I)
MQRAKRSGRKQVCMFDAALDATLERDLRVQSGLHRALANHEFVLHLQPKCDVRTSAIVGAEALLRWDSPDGIIAPNEFIGVAERHGLIKDIGWFVIEETCRMARRLRERNIMLPLAVNLAPAQFTDPGLIPRLCETVARYGVAPDSIIIEITESMAMENAEHMAAVLQTLHALGFRIAMDDFGTGHSSLSKLVSLPVDELKLDRSFIVDIETDPRRRSIVQAIIELAHACGCTVVAEGVETRGQAMLIADLGAEQAQGFHWHRPMPCAAFIDTVERSTLRESRLKLISAA